MKIDIHDLEVEIIELKEHGEIRRYLAGEPDDLNRLLHRLTIAFK